MTRILLTGLTLDRADQLAPRARAWLSPPEARVTGAAAARFDAGERAYVIEGSSGGGTIRIDINASSEHPLVNPAFVVDHWTGGARAVLEGDSPGASHRAEVGFVESLDGRRLIAYFPVTATDHVSFVLTRTE